MRTSRMPRPPLKLVGTLRRNRAALLRSTALQATACLLLAAPSWGAQPAPSAQPQGGQVVAGTAAITTTATTTTITQSSSRAAVNWTSFDVGQNATVTFHQPAATSVTLNRVNSADPSSIAGKITANGQIVITNPNGVVFDRGSQVNAQSVVASAAGITNQNFMAGRMVFDQAPQPNAQVVNRGTITVAQAGLAALVAPSVANSGVINAKLGQVVLAGAMTHTLDMYGDGLVSIDVTKQVVQAPVGANGKPATALVTNTGVINADGGVVQLSAAAADGVVQTLVRAGGHIKANTAGNQTGRIEITGTGGSVVVEGRLSADGRAPGNTGGEVLAMADGMTAVTGGAHISASGRAGGGTITIGTALPRGVTAPSARTVIAPGARIAADATESGNGGHIVLLSSQSTQMGGALSARGGPKGGDGGLIELSGQQGFSLTGTADAAAPRGQLGTILLDPYNLTIVATGTNTVTLNPTAPNLPYSVGGGIGTTDTVTAAAIQSLTGNVQLQAVNNLVVQTSLTLNQAGQSLTLQAGNNLTVNAGATLTAAGSITLSAATAAIPGYNAAGTLSVLGNLTATGSITLDAGTGGINLNGALSAGAYMIIGTPGPLTQTGGSVAASYFYGTASSVSLPSQGNAIGNLGPFSPFTVTGAAGDFALVDSVALTVGNASPGGGVSVQNGRTISLSTNSLTIQGQPGNTVISAPGGSVAVAPFTPGLGMEVTSSTKTAGLLSLTTAELALTQGATLQLGAPLNGIAAAGTINVGKSGETIDLGANGGYNTLQLFATGAVIQNGGPVNGQPPPGQLAVNTVSGQAGTLTLTSTANYIGTLAGFTTTGPLAFHTGIGLLVSAPVSAGNSTVALSSSDGFGAPLTLAANVTGSTVSLDSTSGQGSVNGGINQTGGIITAGTVTLNGAFATLPDQNIITALGATTVTSGLTLTTTQPLSITGDVSNTQGGVTITAPSVIQALNTTLATPTLDGTATNASFNSPTNQVGTIGSFVAAGGSFSLTDSVPLSVATVQAAGGTATLIADQIGPSEVSAITASLVRIAPLTPARPVELIGASAANPNALSLPQSFLNDIATTTLVIGGAGIGSAINIGNAGEAISLTNIATTLQLQTTGAVTQGAAASLTVPDLVGSSASLALTGANAIPSLGQGNAVPGTVTGYTTAGALSLTTSGALTVSNTVSANGALTLVSGGSLSQAAGSVATPGVLTTNAAGAVTLTGGTITAGTLTGNSTSFSAPAATIANLGPYTATGAFQLGNSNSLIVAGALDTGSLTLTLQAGDLTLNAPVVTGAASLAAPGSLTHGAGGSLVAASLTGQAGSVTLGGANQVSTLGNFTSTGGFTLANAANLQPFGLAVTGAVTDGTAIALTSNGPMTLTGTLTAPAIALTALNASNGNGATAAGVITQPGGGLSTGLLTGSAATSATLNAPGNLVATLGAFSAGGAFALTDAQGLTVSGPLTATGNAALAVNGNLAITGSVSAANVSTVASGTIGQGGGVVTAGTLSGSATAAAFASADIATLGAFTTTGGLSLTNSAPLTVTGPVTDGTGISLVSTGPLTVAGGVTAPVVSLTATTLKRDGPPIAGSITQTAGVIAASSQLTLSASGAVQQTGGTIAAGTLAGSSATTTALTDVGNAIATLGAYSSNGGLTLTDGTPLSVSGPVRDAIAVTLNVTGSTTLTGPIATGALSLTATGAITQPSGSVQATTLSGSAGSVNLGQSANAIGTLAAFTTAGDFALTDGSALSIAGAVAAGPGRTLTIIDDNPTFGTIGSLAAPGGTVQLAALSPAGLLVAGGGGVTGNPPITATTLLLGTPTGGPVTIAGPLNLTTVSVLGLESSGAVSEIGAGAVMVPVLTGSAATAVLNGANQVGTLGGFSTPGALVLNDIRNLAINGPVTAGNLTLTGGSITFAGPVSTGALTLTASGTVTQTAGTLIAGTLSGVAAGGASFGAKGTALIGQLGAFNTGGAGLALTDAGPLAITGPLQAAELAIAGTGLVTLAGGSITTNGLPLAQQRGSLPELPGSFIQVLAGADGQGQIVQTGTTLVLPLSGSTATLRLDLPAAGGSLALANLSAPSTNLVLSLGTGRATGQIEAASLLVIGSGGSAGLTGSVGGNTGFTAAETSNIEPGFNVRYLLNGCAIASASCTVQPSFLLPQSFLRPDLLSLSLLDLTVTQDRDDPSLLLPNISDRDY